MAKKKARGIERVGHWAFLIGVIIAIIAGFAELSVVVTSVLIVLGLVVGFLNITGKETLPFLFSVLVLVVVLSFGKDILNQVAIIGPTIARMLSAIIIFIIPATIVVSLRAVFGFVKE